MAVLQLKPVDFTASSTNVATLHKVLDALGYPVSITDEVDTETVGATTVSGVLALRDQLKVSSPVDKNILVDDAMIVAMTQAMEQRGLLDAQRSFTVSGTVFQTNGAIKKRQRLLAFDLDLLGIAFYTNLSKLKRLTIDDINTQGHFEFLGEAVTDNNGNYSIKFFDWQYTRVTQGKASVVVFAVAEDQSTIVGISQIVNSDDYSSTGISTNINILATDITEGSEFSKLTNKITTYLPINYNFLTAATSNEQLKFIAKEVDIDLKTIGSLAKNALQVDQVQQKYNVTLSEELLYALAQQNMSLDWNKLYKKNDGELKLLISQAMQQKVIQSHDEGSISNFLKALRKVATTEALINQRDVPNSSLAMLANTSLDETQKVAFLSAVNNFTGNDFASLWKSLENLPEFGSNGPALVANIILVQQLTLLTGNHQPLVNQLLTQLKVDSLDKLMNKNKSDLIIAINSAGIPDFITGADDSEKTQNYAASIQNMLNATFPTKRIQLMLSAKEIPITDEIAAIINDFIANTPEFDFSTSRVADFDPEIQAFAGDKAAAKVKDELMKMQRVFQVSTTPKAMSALLQNNLDSALAIAKIPSATFVKRYGTLLGGESDAFAIHQRATRVVKQNELVVATTLEHGTGLAPRTVMNEKEQQNVVNAIVKHIPNYSDLFGQPVLCECKACSSVYGAASYLVDLLEYLSKGNVTAGKTPLDIFKLHRPDILCLPLTCENTNTLIPYIDVVNEIMEFYAASYDIDNETIDWSSYKGHDTGNATAAELRANPQNINQKAYENVNKAKYPFTLPYHQPLDAIRTYCDHLQISRYDIMRALNPVIPNDDTTTPNAIAAEALNISLEEYIILTEKDFAGNSITTPLSPYVYFGCETNDELENIAKKVSLFLRHIQLDYIDLVEIIKTKFINPNQDILNFLQDIINRTGINQQTFYDELKRIATNPVLVKNSNTDLILAEFKKLPEFSSDIVITQWITSHFAALQQVITLYEAESNCNLDTTSIRTIKSIYENMSPSGVNISTWKRIYQFIRLWRKLGWTIHETDLMLSALGESEIGATTITKLDSVLALKNATNLNVEQLAVLWGNIDTYGDKSLYKKLFLNKALSPIASIFLPNAAGEVLENNLHFQASSKLEDYKATILAVFKIKEQDLFAIIASNPNPSQPLPPPIDPFSYQPIPAAQLSENGKIRKVSIGDPLSLGLLSTIYRHVLLARALKISIADLCNLINLFQVAPFWDNPPTTSFIFSVRDIISKQQNFIAPNITLTFVKLVNSVKKSGFSVSLLHYILRGTAPANFTQALPEEKIKQVVKTVLEAFAVIEKDNPKFASDVSPSLTSEYLAAKLIQFYSAPEHNIANIIYNSINYLDRYAYLEKNTDTNLNIKIPSSLENKYSYGYDTSKSSGQFRCYGIVTDADRALLALDNPSTNFAIFIDELKNHPTNYLNVSRNDLAVFIVNRFLSLLDNNFYLEAYIDPDAKIKISPSLLGKFVYEADSGRFVCNGIVTDSDRNRLLQDNANGNIIVTSDTTLDAFLDKLRNKVDDYIVVSTNELAVFKVDTPADLSINIPAALAKKYSYVNYIDAHNNPKAQLICKGVMSETESGILKTLSNDLNFQNAIDTLFVLPYSFMCDIFSEIFVDTEVEAAALLDRIDGLKIPPAERLAFVYEHMIPALRKKLRRDVLVQTIAAAIGLEQEFTNLLFGNNLYAVINAFLTSPISLDNKTTFAPIADYLLSYYRVAKFILGFKLTKAEVEYFITHRNDFDNIDFTQPLSAKHWQRMQAYTQLRDNTISEAQISLIDIFTYANFNNANVNILSALLYKVMAWDMNVINYFIPKPNDPQKKPYNFKLTINSFKNEIVLNQLYEIISLLSNSELPVNVLASLGSVVTDFDIFGTITQQVKNAVKAKYDEKNWLDVAGQLHDRLRENQKQALIAYLLTLKTIQDNNIVDADGLFEYFLIDVQMCACMDTSRIVQANAAIQMFVERCHLNLEPHVATDALDKDHWSWMKRYRVWEANRKVFLYPENWLEPEWRNDRSDFFKNLESYLVQNDIIDRNVEQAFRNYLTSLAEVANLEVCGMQRENYDDGKLKFLHVFARTHNAPYKFFYRNWNEFGKWSAWQSLPVDIRVTNATDAGGKTDNSGVHIIPVLWKKRLFIFWPEFIKKQKTTLNESTTTGWNVVGQNLSALKPTEYWEIHLAWSEYVNGKWTPKQLTKEFIYFLIEGRKEADLHWMFYINNDQSLEIVTIAYGTVSNNVSGWFLYGFFHLDDITSKVEAHGDGNAIYKLSDPPWSDYSVDYMSYIKADKLRLLEKEYLSNPIKHKLIVSPIATNYVQNLDTPFFFSSNQKTYFVRPYDTIVSDIIANPTRYIPQIVAELDIRFVEPDPSGPITRPGEHVTLPGGGIRGINNTSTNTFARISQPAQQSIRKLSAGNSPLAKNFSSMRSAVAPALGGYLEDGWKIQISQPHPQTNLEFHIFYHPHSNDFIKNLNQGGISIGNKPINQFSAGLMESDMLYSPNKTVFEDLFDPNPDLVRMVTATDLLPYPQGHTFYQENICFDVQGANSIYNWELFFHAPLYIATRLSKNGRFEEAMKWFHYIFDPTTNEVPKAEDDTSIYWKVLPFKTMPSESLYDFFKSLKPNTPNQQIDQWRANPFDPHLIAARRPLSYMKNVVLKYVGNLLDWADSLFRQFTRETVNESLQLYILAKHILGPRPQFVPKRGKVKAATYNDLAPFLDDFSNAMVQMENIFPYTSGVPITDSSAPPSLLGAGSAFYFSIPSNDMLINHWDTVDDRLYKIRHCQDIDGVERKLALFSPPIDPAALINAKSQGLSLGDILSDLSSPPPIYRFTFLLQKANEFCGDVKNLGSALLSALEKKDAEELGRLRAKHEKEILEAVTLIKQGQILDAQVAREGLIKTRETMQARFNHYSALLNKTADIPAIPSTPALNGELPQDSAFTELKVTLEEKVEMFKEDGSELALLPKEQEKLNKSDASKDWLLAAGIADSIAGVCVAFPQIEVAGKPFGVGGGVTIGGLNFGKISAAVASVARTHGQRLQAEAGHSESVASYIRRTQDWRFQANSALHDIAQLNKQITAADIKIQIANKELDNHLKQINNSQEVELFLQDKFSNQELYQWMKEQLFAVYKQSYNLAFDMAKKAEKAYKFELGTELANFIQYGYWDSAKQGLIAAEKLQLALRQMEQAYLTGNCRELEINKSISLLRLNPLALIQLRETGKCNFSIPEECFDLDFRGHYFRRIKAVRLSIPCVAGPYTAVNCSLRLLSNYIRMNSHLGQGYPHANDEGIWSDDPRFVSNYTPVSAIATSMAQNDSGMFEFNFRDERFLPFERAGVISEWQLELSTDKLLRQFDYETITDVILHMDYTAKEDGGKFKDQATKYMKDFLKNADQLDEPLMQLFNMRHEFPTEWYQFLHSTATPTNLNFALSTKRFPFFVQKGITVNQIDIFVDAPPGNYGAVTLNEITVQNLTSELGACSKLARKPKYGSLYTGTIVKQDSSELNLVVDNTIRNMFLTFNQMSKVENIFIIFHYQLN